MNKSKSERPNSSHVLVRYQDCSRRRLENTSQRACDRTAVGTPKEQPTLPTRPDIQVCSVAQFIPKNCISQPKLVKTRK